MLHPILDGQTPSYSLGKLVCVGRNYAEHAQELNNPVPDHPLLFMKPATSVVNLQRPFRIPQGQGEVHHELEIAVLIAKPLSKASPEEAIGHVAGIGLALDLTLRDVQQQLKEKGHPWERAKAFDGSCPVSCFVSPGDGEWWNALEFSLHLNGGLQQRGNSADMLFAIPELISEISQIFTLQAGDTVLTGTPAGVGPLSPGDELELNLNDQLTFSTRVI